MIQHVGGNNYKFSIPADQSNDSTILVDIGNSNLCDRQRTYISSRPWATVYTAPFHVKFNSIIKRGEKLILEDRRKLLRNKLSVWSTGKIERGNRIRLARTQGQRGNKSREHQRKALLPTRGKVFESFLWKELLATFDSSKFPRREFCILLADFFVCPRDMRIFIEMEHLSRNLAFYLQFFICVLKEDKKPIIHLFFLYFQTVTDILRFRLFPRICKLHVINLNHSYASKLITSASNYRLSISNCN